MKILFLKTKEPQHTRSDLINFMIISALFFLGFILQAHSVLSANDLWLMIAAKRWLSGGNYYHDFVENNPPLIIFISAVPVYLSKIMKIPFITTFRIFVFFIGIVSLIISNQLLQKIFSTHHSKQIALLTLGIGFSYWIIPGIAFGEREHFMLMFIMPYLLSIALRCDQKPISNFYAIMIGFFAALGFGLKPYFLITLILIETYGLFRTKNIRYCMRPELLVLCFTLFCYVASIFFLTSTYMTHIFPMVIHFYLGFEKESWEMLLFKPAYLIILIALLFPIIFIKSFDTRQHLLWLFYLALLGFIAAFLLQRKLWYYHTFPMFSFSFLLLIFYAALQKNNPFDVLKTILCPLLLTMGFISLFYTIFPNSFSHIVKKYNADGGHSKIKKVIEPYAKKGRIYFFTTELTDLTPLSSRLDSLTPRFAAFWMLPGMLHCLNQGPQATCYSSAIQLKHYLLHAVTSDFMRYHPKIVIVRTGKYQPYFYEPPYSTVTDFNFINFFSEDAQFKKIWSHYHFVMKIKQEEIFSFR